MLVYRGDDVESAHRVHVVVADGAGNVVRSAGDPQLPTFLRSGAKPFQALALVASGAADRAGLTEPELALVCGSHQGEPRHEAAALAILHRAGLDERALQCGVHQPRSPGAGVSPLCHNCSGKHAGMLLLQAHLGGAPESYLDPSSPAQRAIRERLEEVAGVRRVAAADERLVDAATDRPSAGGGPSLGHTVGWAIDGCSAPTPVVPLLVGARMFARLAMPSGVSKDTADALARCARAMARFPEMVSGEGGFDTDLMGASEDRLISKSGAEGFQGVGDLASGMGLALKIEDGAHRAVAPATVESFRQLSWLEGRAFEVLGDAWRPSVQNWRGLTVGRIEPRIDLG